MSIYREQEQRYNSFEFKFTWDFEPKLLTAPTVTIYGTIVNVSDEPVLIVELCGDCYQDLYAIEGISIQNATTKEFWRIPRQSDLAAAIRNACYLHYDEKLSEVYSDWRRSNQLR